MNYSKPMRINYKRLFTVWIITLVIAMVNLAREEQKKEDMFPIRFDDLFN